ncbi:MAG: hypothetical protein J07HQX50_02378 [Haloquadratum sp. J07HQX50]|jgi:hypothetical protein|nr:MAG: hypothetical protein J07HQX50_02378 [Haloquadratum sp. J07HQX50]
MCEIPSDDVTQGRLANNFDRVDTQNEQTATRNGSTAVSASIKTTLTVALYQCRTGVAEKTTNRGVPALLSTHSPGAEIGIATASGRVDGSI